MKIKLTHLALALSKALVAATERLIEEAKLAPQDVAFDYYYAASRLHEEAQDWHLYVLFQQARPKIAYLDSILEDDRSFNPEA